MVIVKYCADGMKSVIGEAATAKTFWELFRLIKKRCKDDDPDQTYVYRTGGKSFELVDERRASGCTQYVLRPDNWPRNHNEPL
jgi:hypothetical protein